MAIRKEQQRNSQICMFYISGRINYESLGIEDGYEESWKGKQNETKYCVNL
jgi:hypothetical protein